MHDTLHAVIDLETLALAPTAVVRRAAVIVFDPFETGLRVPEPFELDKPRTWTLDLEAQRTRTLDGATVLWWMQQNDVARAGMVAEGMPVTSPRAFLEELEQLATSVQLYSWAKPSHFDFPVLESLAACVQYRPDVFLHRRRVHNARTLYEIASIVAGESIDEPKGVHGLHDPAVDVSLTAGTIRRALSLIRR